MNLHEQRNALIKAAQAITAKIKAESRAATAEETADLTAKAAELDDLDTKIKAADNSSDTLRRLDGLVKSGDNGPERFLGLSTRQGRKATVEPLIKAMAGPDPMVKAVVPDGTAVGDITMVGIYERPELPTSILDLLPFQKVGAHWAYMKEIERTDNAAVVPVGEVKPSSNYRYERVDEKLRVVAHLSEPIDKYILEDAVVLSEHLQNRMIRGLYLAVEQAILVGDGAVAAGPPKVDNIRGILNISGIQAQAFATDLLTVIRKGITALETLGHEATALVLSPSDWEALELTRRTGDGGFDLGPANLPVDRAKRLVWGVPTVISNNLPAKTGVLLDTSAVTFVGDGRVAVEWNRFSGFSTNEVEMRTEGRFGVALNSPLGVVKLATKA
ncbi:phage major capsid protein [Rhodococcus koreensis]|uniref:phage major capsid protein n=1 Tax=Rhodococcus koreensis TaxID=99653 RepID=UPI00197E73C7|nr:phage major capsid protein [Rhodococcus koreensis]QSE84084.1 phage major capsid protein [Rhodococcus koreensis]